MADEKDLIDRQQVLDVLQKMIDKRCGCSRTSIIEQRALQMAQAIMRLHFLVGKSWRQTAIAVYDYRYADGETCRKYIQRFFKSL